MVYLDNLPQPTNTLLQSVEGDTSYRFHRPTKKNDYLPVPLRWYNVLALHLAGKKLNEIKTETGYSAPMIYRILNHKTIQAVRQQLLDHTQQEFEALFSRVVENIREQLNSKDDQVRLAAQQQWLKANGKFAPKQAGQTISVTAEDVVFQILNQKE